MFFVVFVDVVVVVVVFVVVAGVCFVFFVFFLGGGVCFFRGGVIFSIQRVFHHTFAVL